MTTDKVRVFIDESYKNSLTMIYIRYPQKSTNDSLVNEEIFLSKDRDNWIDITLPEAIDGYTEWKVCIYYEDCSVKENNETIGWKAFMRHKDAVKGQEGYQLQVTVY